MRYLIERLHGGQLLPAVVAAKYIKFSVKIVVIRKNSGREENDSLKSCSMLGKSEKFLCRLLSLRNLFIFLFVLVPGVSTQRMNT
jgi:hypothetical protein